MLCMIGNRKTVAIMSNDIPEPQELNKKPRLERWSKNGAFFGVAVALLDLTGWRGDVYSGSLVPSIGHFVGTIIGGAILFSIPVLLANGIEFVTNKLSGLFK